MQNGYSEEKVDEALGNALGIKDVKKAKEEAAKVTQIHDD